MAERVTDTLVEHWLIYARHFKEIIAWSSGRYPGTAPKGTAKRWRVRLTPGITCNGDPFRAKEGILDLFGHSADDVVPHELMLTSREALIFGYGCAAGRAAAFAGDRPEWFDEWPQAARVAFIGRREEGVELNRADLARESEEREAARQRRTAEYQRQRAGAEEPAALEAGEIVDGVLEAGDEETR